MNCYKFEDLHAGLSHAFEQTVTEEMLAQFCALSGDVNPLHVDRVFAVGHGFPDKVVHGLLTAAFYSRLVGMYLPGKYGVLHGIEITFHQPVFVGECLRVNGEVTYLNGAFRQVEIKAQIVKQHDRRQVSRAKIKVGISE